MAALTRQPEGTCPHTNVRTRHSQQRELVSKGTKKGAGEGGRRGVEWVKTGVGRGGGGGSEEW
jgi:hypothetical protein